jgi:hypothetical protein
MIDIPPEKVLKATIGARIADGKNSLLLVDGVQGSGKSSWCLRMAEILFPRLFTVDYCCFNIQEFLNKFTSCPEGGLILYDEGSSFSSRRSSTSINESMHQVLSLARYTRKSVCICTPDSSFVDINYIRIFNFHGKTISFMRRSAPQWMRIRTGVKLKIVGEVLPGQNARTVPMRYPFVTVPIRNKRTGQTYERDCKIREIWLTKCDDDLWNEYSKRKDQNFKRVLKDAQRTVDFALMKQEAKMSSGRADSDETPSKCSLLPTPVCATASGIQDILNR